MFSLQSPEDVCLVLAARLRALRLARNLSQAELAGMCGTSLSSVRRLEAGGQGAIELLVRAAQALQATEGLEALFVPATRSIAEVEAAVQGPRRRRASKRQGAAASARA